MKKENRQYLLLVNYHYLGDAKYPYPGIHPILPTMFQDQVEELGRRFEFVSQGDILRAIEGSKSLPGKACLLTFDDGLQQQFRVATPILDALKVPAIFFIPGKPYAEKRALTVHRFHWLRSCIPPASLYQAFDKACAELGFADRVAAAAGVDVSGKYFWDDSQTKRIKYLFNVLLSGPEQERLTDFLFGKRFDESKTYFDELYLTRQQVKELDARFAVGTHCYSHSALGRMTESAIEEDITRSIAVVGEMARNPVSISYPFGYEEAVSPTVLSIAQRCGLRIGITNERSFNRTLQCPLALARIDTNDAPGGKRPIFSPNDDDFTVVEPMTMGRTRYVQEIVEE